MYELICKCKKATCFTAIIFLSLLVILFGCQIKEDDITLMKKMKRTVRLLMIMKDSLFPCLITKAKVA